MPVRIQRKRTKGWRMPAGAVYVGRPSRWGNPYVVGVDVSGAAGAKRLFSWWLTGYLDGEPGMCADLPVRDRILAELAELRGKDLLCWCPLSSPCHADVLLELANAENPSQPVRD